MTAINLRKGLEFLAYFGEQDFDPQRNQLQDHSGYGRHATANGGPTVGVEGPNDFEAASFDGSDDKFDTGYQRTSNDSDITVFALLKESGAAYLSGTRVSNGLELRTDAFSSISSTNYSISISIPSEVFVPIVYQIDTSNEVMQAFTDGSLESTTSITPSKLASDDRDLTIGDSKDGGAHFEGSLAVYGVWTRVLSDAEIEQLTCLTAPRRTML